MTGKSHLIIASLLLCSVALLFLDTGLHVRSKLMKIRSIVSKNETRTPTDGTLHDRVKGIASVSKGHDATMAMDKNRYKKMAKFFGDYRDTSKQANVALLGDMIHEILRNHITALVVPFDEGKYCNDFAATRWCHLMTLDLFIFPATVKYEEYTAALSDAQYRNLKEGNLFSMKGSDGVIMHVSTTDDTIHDSTFYVYGYRNEIFIVPRSVVVQ